MKTETQNETPVMDAAREAHATVVTEPSHEEVARAAIQRFEGTFTLESELVGARRSVSRKGGVKLSLLPLNSNKGASLASISGKKGDELQSFKMEQEQRLKGNAAALVGRINASNDWMPKHISLDATGNRVTFAFERKEPVAPLVTQTDAIKALAAARGVSVEAIAEALSMVEKPV